MKNLFPCFAQLLTVVKNAIIFNAFMFFLPRSANQAEGPLQGRGLSETAEEGSMAQWANVSRVVG